MFKFLMRFLEKLAKSNEKEFQGQNPDCCTINKPEQTPQRPNNSEHNKTS
ncbi:MAG: hypothetical protein KGZ63_03685 [Clostridiales bacterium]|nr:hypothetical protein [Clostridiales bacterium]